MGSRGVTIHDPFKFSHMRIDHYYRINSVLDLKGFLFRLVELNSIGDEHRILFSERFFNQCDKAVNGNT